MFIDGGLTTIGTTAAQNFYTTGQLTGASLAVQTMRLNHKNMFSIYDSNKLHLDPSEWHTLRMANLTADDSV